MPSGFYAIFGVTVVTPLVRYGADYKIPKKQGGHLHAAVYGEMLLQVARDYPGLPDVRTLKASEIRFFYEGLRPELKKHTGG